MIDDLSSLSSDDLAALSAAVPGLSSTFSGLAAGRAMPTSAPATPPMASQQQQPPPQMMPGGIDTSGIYGAINSILRQQTSPSATASWSTSPLFQGMLGLAQGFGQAAMPTPYRMPFGAVIGMGAGGLSQGLAAGQQAQVQQAQLQQERMKNLMTAAALPMSLQQLQYKTNILQQIQTPEGRARLGMPDLDFSSLGRSSAQPTPGTTSQTPPPPSPVASGTTMDTSTIQPASGWSMYAALPPEKQKWVDAAAAQHPEIPGYRDIIANHIWNESRAKTQVDPGDSETTPGGKSYGVMQMQAGTLAGYNAMHGTNYTIDDLQKDGALATRVGADYWADLYKQNNNNPFITSMAYARGPGATGAWIKGGSDFAKLSPQVREILGNIYGPNSFPGASPSRDSMDFYTRRNQATTPNVAPGFRVAGNADVAPPSNANLTPAPPSPAAVSDANVIASRVSGGGGGGQGGGGTAVAQASPLTPPAGPSPLTPPASATAPPGGSLALPPGVALSPQAALAQSQRLTRAAMLGDLVGMPLFGDPTMLREQAKIFLQYGLAPSQKAYEAAVEANTKLQYAAPTGFATKSGELAAEASPTGQAAALARLGFQVNKDGSASPIQGGPADPAYVGAKAAAEKEAQARVALQYGPQQKQREAIAVLPTDLLKEGWQLDKDGNVSPVPGMQHDPLQIGAEEAAKQKAQKQIDVQFARQIAVEQNLGKPVDLSRPGSQVGVPQRDGSYKWYQSPTVETIQNSDGRETKVFVAKPAPDAPAGTAPIVTPITDAAGLPIQTKMPLQQQEQLSGFGKGQGGALAKDFDQNRAQAASAVNNNYLFDNMRNEARSWTPDRFAPSLQEARNYFLSFGHLFGLKDEDMPQLNEQVGDFNSFNKNAGMVLREAVKETSNRAAVQEYRLISETLPTAETPYRSFMQLADQYQGLNDYRIAKEQFQRNYANRPQDMQADWDAKVSPTSFMINRMMATPEGQQDFSRLVQSLKDHGQIASLTKMLHDYNYAKGAGLFDSLPGGPRGG